MKPAISLMPKELQRICSLFDSINIVYLLFKCEHILAGENKNLDVLLKTAEDYARVSLLLEQQGYALYLDETIEKYKKMYVHFDGKIVSAVHLHREVAWHGLVVLDKEKIFQRATGIIPSPEDSLLIHTAHILFENFRIKEKDRPLLEGYKQETNDWDYINSQLSSFGWKKAFYEFITGLSVNNSIVVHAYVSCLWKKPKNAFNLFVKVAGTARRKTSLTRKGYLISLIGMNGSGKSTTQTYLLNKYAPLTDFATGQYGYYFGWKQSPLGKIISKLKPRKDKKLFDQVSEEKINSFSFFQELLFMYIFCNFLFRYYKNIYPCLRKNKLVITDRYFYDLYGQYPYSQKSILLKILHIPKPNRLVVLDADIEIASDRDKGGTAVRVVQPKEKLGGQRERYLAVGELNGALIVNANRRLDENISLIINDTWKIYLGCK